MLFKRLLLGHFQSKLFPDDRCSVVWNIRCVQQNVKHALWIDYWSIICKSKISLFNFCISSKEDGKEKILNPPMSPHYIAECYIRWMLCHRSQTKCCRFLSCHPRIQYHHLCRWNLAYTLNRFFSVYFGFNSNVSQQNEVYFVKQM